MPQGANTVSTPSAPCNCFPDDLAIVRCTRENGDPPFETVEFSYAALPTNTNHLVAPIQGMLNHVSPELPGRTHNTNRFHMHPYPQ